MAKRVSIFLVAVMLLACSIPMMASGEAMTDVGTPRSETLILEPDDDVNVSPGQFNTYMIGTRSAWGIHNLLREHGLWEVNTITGELVPTIAAEPAVPNEDYTEWTIKLRDNLKWSDGEALDAEDVVFTMEMILANENLVNHPIFKDIFAGAEVVDNLTVKIKCNMPFTRLHARLGIVNHSQWFVVVPEHVYSKVDDVMAFTDPEPLASGPYVVKDYDKLGTWMLYEKREDWANTPSGILVGEPGPKYILYRVFGGSEARVMAAINNEVDVMNEVSYEDLQLMMAANPNIRAWYEDFPYATTDDACAKGVFFNNAVAPFDNADVRWALTLACNWIEVSENIFEGIGRMSALQVPAITPMMDMYYKPMKDWLTNEFTLADGYSPWNPNFTQELVDALVEDYGYDLAKYSEDELETMFGIGFWKTDVEKATEILSGIEGFELKDGKWHYQGAPWKIEMIVHTEESAPQAARSGKAIADQWQKFGIDMELVSLTQQDAGSRKDLGEFQVADMWDTCSGYGQDFYYNISGWNDEVYQYEIGELATGVSGYRLYKSDPELSGKISQVIRDVEPLDPASEETREKLTEFLKLMVEARPNIMVHSGTKIVPVNTTYWSGFPTAENPYEGPWWWWAVMKRIVCHLEPSA